MSFFFVCTAALAQPALPQTGCAAWQKIAAVRVGGTSADSGLTGKLTATLDARDGRYVATRDYGFYSQSEGFDGKLSWGRDMSGGSHYYDADMGKAIAATTTWLLRRGWCGARDTTIEKLPDEKDNGATLSVWRVTPPGGIPAILRFDPKTGLIAQSEVQLWSNRLIRHYGDWRDAGAGIVFPFKETDVDPEDEDTETIALSSVLASGKPAPDSIFVKPPPPRDYGIAHSVASNIVPYEDDGVGRIYVPVFIDGKGPFTFEIDTGGHLIVTPETAATLGLKPAGNFSNTGGGSAVVKSGLAHVNEITVGSAYMRNQIVNVLPLSEAGNNRGLKPPRAGIFGVELFERFAVTLNRANKTIALTPLEQFQPPAGGIALPVSFIEDAPLTPGSFNGTPGMFELDSGDAGPAIIEGYWAAQHGFDKVLSRGIDWAGSGVGGEYQDWIGRGDLSLGALKLPHEIVSYEGQVSEGSESTHMQAGVVGESSLRRYDMTYDYGRETVWIDPAPKAPALPFNRAGLRMSKQNDGTFSVGAVIPNSPAAAAGMKKGDRVLALDAKPAREFGPVDAALLLSGPVGSDVAVTLAAAAPGGAARTVHVKLRELLP